MGIRGIFAAFAVVLASTACSVEEVDDLDELEDEEDEFRGLKVANGLKLANGLKFANGLKLANGTPLTSGLATGTGLTVASALDTEAGLSSTTGLMTSDAGQELVKYLVECALPTGTSITKNNPVLGGTKTFTGAIGLAAEWRTGACNATCQQKVSACLLARTNEIGNNVLIDMRSSITQIGTTASGPQFVVQEGAFFGNLFANPPVSYACKGVDGSFGVFEGRTCANGGACAMQGLSGHCRDICKKGADKTVKDCKVGATTYMQVVNTYLDPTPWSVGCPPGCDACYNGTCSFICTPNLPCNNQTLDCPDGWACEVVCDGHDTCKSSIIDCTGANECALTFAGDRPGDPSTINCGIGDCDLVCDGLETCHNTTMKVLGAGNATMTCLGGLSGGEQCLDQGAGTCTKTGC